VRIAIAGISGECSTFSLDVMRESIFEVLRGPELLEHYDWPGRLGELVDGVEWVPIARAASGAGGPVDPEFYDRFEAEVMAGLAASAPYDAVYLDMHGALAVLGRTRLEERFVGKVREIAGPDAVLAISMDPHGNFSEELARLIDVAACYRHAPHIDRLQTRDRAVTSLLEVLRSGVRPAKSWMRVPVLLPGERTSTLFEPATSIFGDLIPSIERFGVQDVNLWCGFPWADEDRNAAAVFATASTQEAADAAVAHIGQQYWDARADFGITSPHSGTWGEALDFVLAGSPRPVYLSDAGDNVTAGGSGDTTAALHETLARDDVRAAGVEFLFAGLVDEPTLDAAIAAGVGAVLERGIGAVVDARTGGPVAGSWTVESLIDGVYGEGIVGAVLRDGTVSVSVQRFRQRFVGALDDATPAFAMIGLAFVDIAPYDVVVVKNGYLFPNQRAMAGSEFLAMTPGGTDLDFDRLEFTRLWRPTFPMDRDFEAELVPLALPVAALPPLRSAREG
jgi:microcystin degradation protein MlrC